MVTLILLGILVLGPYYSQITMFPSYELGRRIDVGNFLQGIEVVIAILWFITLFFKLCIYFYATLLGFANVFHIKDYKLFSFPCRTHYDYPFPYCVSKRFLSKGLGYKNVDSLQLTCRHLISTFPFNCRVYSK